MYPRSMDDSDCVVVMGSNMAENHPVAFRWPMKRQGRARREAHPRRSALHAHERRRRHLRAGPRRLRHRVPRRPDQLRHQQRALEHDPFFRTWVATYTNAATIIADAYRDAEDNDGVFSGLMEYNGGVPEWPYNGFARQYDDESWQYAGTRVGDQGRVAATAQSGETPGTKSGTEAGQAGGSPPGPPVRRARPVAAEAARRSGTRRCRIRAASSRSSSGTSAATRRRWSSGRPAARATRSCKVAETILANSGADRTTSFAYAVAWTQHTNGPQIIGCCALLQLLLGNFGRPGRRHHGAARPRLDPGLDRRADAVSLDPRLHAAPRRRSKQHDTLHDYLAAETVPTGYWANMPKFMVSYLKSMYGDAATPENEFGYDWHPRIFGDHSHMPMFVAMNDGKVKGMLCIGQNPATSLNAKLERAAMRKLEWLVVKDNWVHETANFWKTAPEVVNGEVSPGDIKTEVFFFPSAQVAETEGTFTNTQRMLQWHYKAAEAPGDCRTDVVVHLPARQAPQEAVRRQPGAARPGIQDT